MTLSSGTRLGPYEILSPLGAGGMGEVYRARDQKLDRDVAVKVLPQSVAADPDSLARFEREAKAVAALSHQNILAIHDFGNQDGIAYAVMELLEGETLRGKLDAGQIPQKQAVDYALQVAKGLSAAHEKGIVHRDLKPENLFVSRDGHLKILDFGLAKRVEAVAQGQETSAPTGSGHTEPGMVMGTMGYMSPEQVKGFPVDHRSDIFSFGTILYELLSGRKAFKRDTNAETMAAILMREPPEFSESGRNISPSLERIVKHCLEKDRESRFQTARDIAFSLSEQFSPAAAASSAPKVAASVSPSGFQIAVRPFKFGTADADVLALADGLSEEIVSGLSRFRYLSVVASGAAGHQAAEGDDRAPGPGSGARYVMEGSIRRGGADLRVSAQLVDARTGARLWSETYRRDLQASGMFAVQDDVAARIVATVADSYGVLVHSIRAASGQKNDADLTPVEWQFQYFAYREQITPSSYAALKSRLERALERVERSDRQSEVWACLAQVYVDEYAFGFASDATSLDRALAAARRAVELDRANQFAMVALAQVHFFRQDLAAFGPAAERAMALNPLNTDAVGILGLQIVHTGEFERGAAIVRRAMELNPNHAGWMHFAPLWEHFHKGEYEQALERANRVDVPGLFWPFLVVASACGHLGRRAEAESAVRDLLAIDPEFAAHARSNVGTWHFASGLMEPILDGLRKAGLEAPAEDGSASARKRATSSGPSAAGSVHAADESFWVAVLPFKYGGADASLTALAEGLTEEIVTGLSRFSYLKVIARSATASGRSGHELGARYVMEGSLRQAGTRLRIAVQLVDAVSGAHLWAENYERPFSPEAVFELQDDLVPRIVSTVADMHGVLSRSMSETLRSRTPEQLSPYEAVLRGFGYFERATAEELAAARSALESAVRKAPAYADAWAMLSILSTHEYGQAFDLQADSLTSGSAAARRAVEASSSNHLAWFSLAQALFFQKEFQSFRNAAERAVSLNPMDGDSIATLGGMLTCAGELERGLALARRAKQLNPHHPGWYWWVDFCNAYRERDYRGALGFALKMNLPGHWFMHAAMGAAYGQLGERAAASKAVQDLLQIRPDFAATIRMNIEKWWEPDFVEHLMDGWRKAGLEIPGDPSKPGAPPARMSSGAARADEGFWVAVLPFQYTGGSADLTALAEGLTDDIVTGLSRFSYLRVIARSSTPRLADSAGDVRSVGKELGARYVMEGTLRQAGGKLRLAVQLLDAVSGAHLWAENYERPFNPEAVFELQDDLVPRIVSMVAGMNGVLPRSMSEAVRGRAPEQLSPYEAVLRSFGYLERVTPEELAVSRSGLELAVGKEPDYADAWAMLALLCLQDYAQGFGLQPDSLARGLDAARRAVEAAPSSPLALFSLAQALFFQKEFESFRNAAERAAALNPMDGNSIAFLGELLTYSGDSERGLTLAGRAKQLNPNHPGWYWYADYYNAYRQGDDRGALDVAHRINLSGHWGTHVATAAACGQLGQRDAAGKALRELLKLRPRFATTARSDFEKWWAPDYVQRLIDGLRKAGLELPAAGKAENAALETPDATTPQASGAGRADEGFWVAVLPFKSGGGAELTALAEGLTEEIVTGLARFSYLRVISRSSTARYAATADVRAVAQELGARFVMDGSLRHAGGQLRVAVQLVDAATGVHLWAETYARPFQADQVFAIQDDLVPRIVSTSADHFGVLARTISDAVREKPVDRLTPYEALMRGFGYHFRLSPEEHAEARDVLERAVEGAPANADCWAMLSWLYAHEHAHGFNPRPGSLDRALTAARRAVDLAPTNSLAQQALAVVLFFRKETAACLSAAERAIALNPLDGSNEAIFLITFAGGWDRGLTLLRWAMDVNPYHPRWYELILGINEYRLGRYQAAVDEVVKANLPEHFWKSTILAAAHGQLGELDAAREALRDLLARKPHFSESGEQFLEKWFDPQLVGNLLEGLRKGGLEIDGASATDAREGVAIAVLPFSDMSPSKDQEYLCEGMAEEVMNALVAIPGIRVASRTSAFRARHGGKDLSEIARALSVGHILEGSVRTSGSRLRVTAQLTDVASGYQLWSERYDRDASDVFAVQDEIAAGVVEAVRSRLSPGARGIQPRPQVGNLEAYRHYLQGRHFRYSKNDHGSALRAYEQAVALDPSHAPSWIGLAEVSILAAFYALIPTAAAYARASDALSTAAQLQGESAEALYVEGFMAFGRRNWEAWEKAQRRAIELDPSHVQVRAVYGVCLTARRRLDEAMVSIQRARELDPLAPFPHAMTGLGLLASRRVEESIRSFDDALSFDKENSLALWGSGAAHVALGRYEKGIALLERAATQTRRGGFVLGILGWALAAGGRREEARAVLAELRARPEPAPAVVSEVWLLAALGDVEGAFELLARAEEERQPYLPFTGLPGFDLLRADPRFGALLDRLGLPREQKAGLEIAGASAADAREGVAIAVLPFADMSPAKDQQYLCEGMAEEIMSALVRVPGIRVASRTSAFRAQRHGGDLSAIARSLSVGHVLEGSVRTSGSRLRVSAQLTDVASGYQLLSERFDREAADIFAVQDEIAAGVVEAVRARLAPGEHAVSPRPQPANLEAYRSYLMGRHLRGKEHHVGALHAFEEAVRLDPSHAPSWTGLAETTVLASVFGLIPAREACATARKALATAERLQGESAEGLHVEAFVAWIERRWAAMETAWRRAIELQPTHVLALASFGIVLCTRQRLDEALPFLERARQADPLASFPYALTGGGLLNCGKLEEALRYLDDALSFEKEDATALDNAGIALVALRRFEEGIARLEHVVAVSHRAPHFLGTLGWALATAGRKEEARRILEELRARPPGAPAVVSEAWLLGALGEIDAAFEVVARAEEESLAYLYFTGLPAFDSLRSDPRFGELLERLGLPREPGPGARQ